jgi:hypothetical protein
MTASAISSSVLDRLAAYCAFRSREFRVDRERRQQLSEILPFNLKEEFGNGTDEFRGEDLLWDETDLQWLTTASAIVVDGRMHPWEWVQSPDGSLLKVDGCTHGDDHFLPGPTDIAWDLAGAIVEWEMDRAASDYFLDRYTRISGEDPRGRLPIFTLAYTMFRLGYCKMAAGAEAGTPEESRLLRDYRYYRSLAEQQIATASERRGELAKIYQMLSLTRFSSFQQ